MERIEARRSLGQNFLVDRNIIGKIIAEIGPGAEDSIIEIGPGAGALTGDLAANAGKLVAVDPDKRAIELLSREMPGEKYPGFSLVNGDIRDIQISEYFDGMIKVAGNIPYNISADIFFWLYENSGLISKAVLMVQKEVALRLTAGPGTKDNGILAIAASMLGRARKCFDVSANCFRPRPHVTSSIVSIEFDPAKLDYLREQNVTFSDLITMVKYCFRQRRKILRNPLLRYLAEVYGMVREQADELLRDKVGDYISKRPEQLAYSDFIDLYMKLLGRR